MLKLCAKDFIASRWLWLLVIAADILYIPFPLQQNLGLMVGALALVLGCIIATLFLEDRLKTETLYSSLPLKRSTMVLSRYLLTGFLTLGCGVFVFGYGYFLSSVVKLRFVQIDFQSLLTAEGVAGFIVFTAFIAALFYPFYFRLGLGRGSFIFAAVLLALGIIFTGLERLAAHVFRFTRPLFTEEFLKDPGLGIVRALGGIENSLGQPLFISSALILIAGMLFLSIRLSIRFYEKRDF
jgi:ABC-2 type transport system permease protein